LTSVAPWGTQTLPYLSRQNFPVNILVKNV
jgi:hypothetical protein